MERRRRSAIGAVMFVLAVSWSALAADSPIGTYAKLDGNGKPTAMTMTIERWGSGGAKLVYRMAASAAVLTLESKLDGSDAPLLIDGKASGQTMGIKRVDAHHSATVLKMGGKPYGTSKGTFSGDFSKLTVENTIEKPINPVQTAGKTTETWVRK